MGEWTTGDWRATKHTDTRGWTVSAAGVSVASVRPRARPGEAEANARVVAAAPALYDALTAVVEALHGRVHSEQNLRALADAQRALAQADGRDS